MYWPHRPPRATSSPSTQTRSSRRISCSAARRAASISVTSTTPPPPYPARPRTRRAASGHAAAFASARAAAISAFAASRILPSSAAAMPRSASTAAQPRDRIARARLVDLFGRPPCGRIGRGVAGDAIGAHMQEVRPLAAPHRRDRDRRPHRRPQHVVAVDRDRRDAERLGALGDARPRRDAVGAREGRDAVVLAHEQHRQLVERRPVQPFEERPAIDRAVAEHAGRDRVGLLHLQALRGADRDRDAARDHAVRAEHADGKVRDVHRAALAAAVAACRGRKARASCASGRRPWRWRGRGRDGSR